MSRKLCQCKSIILETRLLTSVSHLWLSFTCSAGAFLAVLITMLVVRGVTNANKTMEFATNLMLAGTIIFVNRSSLRIETPKLTSRSL